MTTIKPEYGWSVLIPNAMHPGEKFLSVGAVRYTRQEAIQSRLKRCVTRSTRCAPSLTPCFRNSWREGNGRYPWVPHLQMP